MINDPKSRMYIITLVRYKEVCGGQEMMDSLNQEWTLIMFTKHIMSRLEGVLNSLY